LPEIESPPGTFSNRSRVQAAENTRFIVLGRIEQRLNEVVRVLERSLASWALSYMSWWGVQEGLRLGALGTEDVTRGEVSSATRIEKAGKEVRKFELTNR
jgi:hypothetical protein